MKPFASTLLSLIIKSNQVFQFIFKRKSVESNSINKLTALYLKTTRRNKNNKYDG